MEKLGEEVEKDELIQYIRKELDELHSNIEILLDELESRM